MIATHFQVRRDLDKFLCERGDGGLRGAHGPSRPLRARLRTAPSHAIKELPFLNERRVRDGKEAISVGIGVSAGEAGGH